MKVFDVKNPLRIGTRGSPLALWQANHVAQELRSKFSEFSEPNSIEIVKILTTGDKIQDRPLADIGGKGLFAKEIQEALAAYKIDIAVHSMKDVETILPKGFAIVSVLKRADPRDALISNSGRGLMDLPKGARVGTSSLRRKAQILAVRPDLNVIPFRGNVGTRLAKLAKGEAEATLLAKAGLDRLKQPEVITEILSPSLMIPAAAQGAIGIEARQDDEAVGQMLAEIGCPESTIVVETERALLAELDGSCRTPIGAHAELDQNGGLRLSAMLAREDGMKSWRVERFGSSSDSIALGRDAGAELRANGEAALFLP
jgi:hydroxymethylbilane synthase